MKAFEVFVNGTRVCLAGLDGGGLLIANVNVFSGPDREDQYFLSVGAVDRHSEEHLRWDTPTIDVGTEVMIRVLDVEVVDPPIERSRMKKKTSVDEYRQSLRECKSYLTPDERKQLIMELVTELKALESGTIASGEE